MGSWQQGGGCFRTGLGRHKCKDTLAFCRPRKLGSWFKKSGALYKDRRRETWDSFWGVAGTLVLLAAWLGLMTWGTPAWSAGFALVQQGTAAMGQGNAFVAEANDPSAIFYNPAGLNQLQRPQLYQGTFLNYPDREYHGDNGFSQTNHRWFHTASVYVAGPVNSRVALGLGMFSPFGQGTMWPPSWQGRYITTFSSLKTYNVNPVVSVKVRDNLSLAAGIDMLWSAVDLKRKIPVIGVIPRFDGESFLSGDGMGVGYNLGALYEPVSGVKLGVHFRSEINVKHRGSLTISLPKILPSGPKIDGSANLTYPPSVTFGIAYNRINPFTFLFDVTWTGWSTFEQLRVDLNGRLLTAGGPVRSLVTPKDWRDAWAFRFGANYEIKPGIKLRAGYIYDMTPVPDQTLDPQLPDANRHVFTIGKEFKYKRFTFSAAYNYILFENRTKNNIIAVNGVPAPLQANGRYSSDVHSLGVSWAFQF